MKPVTAKSLKEGASRRNIKRLDMAPCSVIVRVVRTTYEDGSFDEAAHTCNAPQYFQFGEDGSVTFARGCSPVHKAHAHDNLQRTWEDVLAYYKSLVEPKQRELYAAFDQDYEPPKPVEAESEET